MLFHQGQTYPLSQITVSGGIGVKILEVVNSVVGLKSTDRSLESVVARQISCNLDQLLQIEASRCN